MTHAIEIEYAECLDSYILANRLSKGSTNKTVDFKIIHAESIVGLFIFEHGSELYDLIYEIYVLPEFQGQGIGKWILSYGERLAMQRKKSGVRLKPFSLSHDSLNNEQLNLWYARNGYIACPEEEDYMIKYFP